MGLLGGVKGGVWRDFFKGWKKNPTHTHAYTSK